MKENVSRSMWEDRQYVYTETAHIAHQRNSEYGKGFEKKERALPPPLVEKVKNVVEALADGKR